MNALEVQLAKDAALSDAQDVVNVEVAALLERNKALEAKCDLLAASLGRTDALADALLTQRDALLESLRIYVHAHHSGCGVPPHLDQRARAAIKAAES